MAHWKTHKNLCSKAEKGVKLMNTKERESMACKILLLHEQQDHLEILSHVKYFEQLLLDGQLIDHNKVLHAFSFAYHRENTLNPSQANMRGYIKVDARRASVLGALQQYEEQGQILVVIAFACYKSNQPNNSAQCFEKARKSCLGSHSLDIEVESAIGLGILSLEKGVASSMGDGTWESGIDILRTAALASKLISDPLHRRELFAMRNLIHYLFRKDDTFQEGKDALDIYRAMAHEVSTVFNDLTVDELHAYLLTARMFEVIQPVLCLPSCLYLAIYGCIGT